MQLPEALDSPRKIGDTCQEVIMIRQHTPGQAVILELGQRSQQFIFKLTQAINAPANDRLMIVVSCRDVEQCIF